MKNVGSEMSVVGCRWWDVRYGMWDVGCGISEVGCCMSDEKAVKDFEL